MVLSTFWRTARCVSVGISVIFSQKVMENQKNEYPFIFYLTKNQENQRDFCFIAVKILVKFSKSSIITKK
jgi:hypothetical protein